MRLRLLPEDIPFGLNKGGGQLSASKLKLYIIMSNSKLTKKNVTQSIRNSYGILSNAAKSLGIERKELARLVKKFRLEPVVDDERDKIADLAENMLIERLNEGSENMIKFVLLSFGAERGYSDKPGNKDNSKLTLQELISNAQS